MSKPTQDRPASEAVAAPGPGRVKKIHVQPGQNVEGKDILLELE